MPRSHLRRPPTNDEDEPLRSSASRASGPPGQYGVYAIIQRVVKVSLFLTKVECYKSVSKESK